MIEHSHSVEIHYKRQTVSLTFERDPACPPHVLVKAYQDASADIALEAGLPRQLLAVSLFMSDGWRLSGGLVKTPSWLIDYALDTPYEHAPAYLKSMLDSAIRMRAEYDIIVDKRSTYIIERQGRYEV